MPDGWEFLKIGTPDVGEFYLNNKGIPCQCDGWGWTAKNYVIIRKIKKPKQYRQFANADEFKPYRDRWWRFKDDGDSMARPPEKYWNGGSLYFSWKDCFETRVFDDGSPFGVEVSDE